MAILLGIFATVLIFIAPQTIPHLSFDEVEFARLALSLAQTRYTPYSPLATGHSTLYFYALLGSLINFGTTPFALRFTAAVAGIVSALLFYRIMRKQLLNHLVATTTTILLIGSHWYLTFSRFAFEATFLLMLELFSIWFFLKYFETNRRTTLLYSAVFAGLAFHSYYPGRIFFLLPVGILIFSKRYRDALLYGLITAAIAVPLITHQFMQPDIRVSQILFLSDPHIPLFEKIAGLISNVLKTIGIPFVNGDMNGRHNFPGKAALNPILGLLLIGGLITKKSNESKHIRHAALAYIVLSVIPTLATAPNDNPSMLRTFTAIAPLFYFIGTFLDSLVIILKQHMKEWIVAMVIGAIVVLSVVYELRTYFYFQSHVFRNAFEITCPLGEMINTDPIPDSCLVQHDMFGVLKP